MKYYLKPSKYIADDCPVNFCIHPNEYIQKWLGEGKYYSWGEVFSSLSKGTGALSDACPECQRQMVRTECEDKNFGKMGRIDVCIPCGLQYNHSEYMINLPTIVSTLINN